LFFCSILTNLRLVMDKDYWETGFRICSLLMGHNNVVCITYYQCVVHTRSPMTKKIHKNIPDLKLILEVIKTIIIIVIVLIRN
jgi:dipeptide/tripeptide permease